MTFRRRANANMGGKCLFNSSVKAKREPHLPVGKTTRLPTKKEVVNGKSNEVTTYHGDRQVEGRE